MAAPDRLTAAAFAGSVVLLVGAIAFWQAGQTVRAEQEALVGRSRATAVALSDGVVLGSLEATRLEDRLETVGTSDTGTAAITLLVPTGEPGRMKILADWARDRASQPAGVEIDAGRSPKLVRGLRELTVSTDGGIEAYAPVQAVPGANAGVVAVRVDHRVLADVRQRAFVSASAISAIAAIGVALLAWMLLQPRAESARRSAADAAAPPPPEGASLKRLDHLAKAMHERHYVKHTFGRYVSQRVADVLAAEHGALGATPDEREVTVLCGHLDGGPMSPHAVVGLLNEWMIAAVDAVDAQGGLVARQEGDTFVAVFGAPAPSADHAVRAVRAARTLRERLVILERDWEKNGHLKTGPAPTMRLVAHTGRVIVGNLGTPMRARYGVVGAPVTLACRVAAQAGPGDVLVTETTLRALPNGLVTPEERTTIGAAKVFAVR